MSDQQEKNLEYEAVKKYLDEVSPPEINVAVPSTWSKVILIGLLVAVLLSISALLINIFAGLTK